MMEEMYGTPWKVAKDLPAALPNRSVCRAQNRLVRDEEARHNQEKGQGRTALLPWSYLGRMISMTEQTNTRREFLQSSVVGAAALSLTGVASAADEGQAKGLPTRPLGKTGVRVSILCLGGWHIGDVKNESE